MSRFDVRRLMSEREWLNQIRRTACLYGWRTYHTHDDSRRSEPGFPDLVAVRGSRLLIAELKTSNGRLTPDQRAWIDALGGVGGPPEVRVWRPDDWPDVLADLRASPERTEP